MSADQVSLDHDAIRERADAATEGPWTVNDAEQTVRVDSAEGGKWGGEIVYDRSGEHPPYWLSEFRPTAEFIAHARTDVPALLDENARLRAAIERVEALAGPWEAQGENDMAFSKSVRDEHIAMALLTSGADMVENARHIRAALGEVAA